MKKLRISKIWIAMIVVIIVAVAAWLFSGSKNEEQIDFKQEAVTTHRYIGNKQKQRKVGILFKNKGRYPWFKSW